MNRSELLEFHREFCLDALRLMEDKNADYAADSDPFQNFEVVERLGLTDTATGMWCRLLDKVQRGINLCKKQNASVTTETLSDTLLDLVNYSILIAAKIESLSYGSSSPKPLGSLSERDCIKGRSAGAPPKATKLTLTNEM